jgi:hypothetical protein
MMANPSTHRLGHIAVGQAPESRRYLRPVLAVPQTALTRREVEVS